MSMMNRIRNRRDASRRARAIDRALQSAPTPSFANEIMLAQLRQFR
ncbi:hypothetical protein ACFFWC_04405 [Plantactinospora siamensis]|uniref:Uncharacterized protein n=1 Tax=Plantactinospora siamensis TaxID=555372 RepID=A0ABV6NR49_9ACTN